jgi:hypothetical protein
MRDSVERVDYYLPIVKKMLAAEMSEAEMSEAGRGAFLQGRLAWRSASDGTIRTGETLSPGYRQG